MNVLWFGLENGHCTLKKNFLIVGSNFVEAWLKDGEGEREILDDLKNLAEF